MAVLLCCMLASAVWGVTGDTQMASYQQINERNAFNLKPLPPPGPDPATLAATQQVNITFTGITSFNGVKKAYFRLPDGTKPGQFTYPTIREGERDGILEVVTINEKAGSVVVKNAGAPMTLTFEANGNKVTGPMAAIAPPPGVSALPGSVPVPNPMIPPNTPAQPAAGMQGIPSRQVRSNIGAAANNMGAAATMQPQPTYESATVNMEIQRALHASKVASGDMPPLPPTELSSPPAPQ
jgi:hypothetical protein